MRSFGSCAALVGYARAHGAAMVGSGWLPGTTPGLAVGVAAPPSSGAPQQTAGAAPETKSPAPAPDFSTTNVQEQGIDEPDVVKTDGRRIYAVVAGVLYVVDARADPPKVLGSVRLAEGGGHELLLAGDRVLVLQNAYAPVPLGGPELVARPAQRVGKSIVAPGVGAARLTEVSVADPAAPRIVRTERVDGQYVAARLTGDTARVVIASPSRVFDELPVGIAARRAAVRRARLSLWRPRSLVRTPRTRRTALRPAVACDDVRRPETFGGTSMLTVLTVDMAQGLPAVDSDGLMSDVEVVYGSADRLYVATRRWLTPAQADGIGAPPPPLRTAIHAFDASRPRVTSYRASGEVEGYLLNQYSLSERKGILRVASTDEPTWSQGTARSDSQSRVTTLDERGAVLAPLGSVDGLGRGERIYAVRFIDDVGYVVTFRQVDPLYTIGLADPSKPKLLGELKIAGYSAYLHPVGGDRLLGVGQDAGPDGRTRGTQISLFDVSDPAAPTRVAQRAADAGSSSDVEFDPRAFLYWAPTRLAVVPMQAYGEQGQGFVGAVGYRISPAAIDEVARISHPLLDGFAPALMRSLVVGDRLFTLSERGLLAGTLAAPGAGPFIALG